MIKYNNDKKFDFVIDLQEGQEGESQVAEILSGKLGPVEVKTEVDMWYKTRNIVFEIFCYNKPSGITATEAVWWVQIFKLNGQSKSIHIWPVVELKKRLMLAQERGWLRRVKGGENMASDMLLYPIEKLWFLDGLEDKK